MALPMLALMLGAAARVWSLHVLLQHPGEGHAGRRSMRFYYARIQRPDPGDDVADAKRSSCLAMPQERGLQPVE